MSMDGNGTYGVVDVRSDNETFFPSVCTVIDGNDITGLNIVFHHGTKGRIP